MRSAKLYRASGGALSRTGTPEISLRLQQCSISMMALRHPSDPSSSGTSGTSTSSIRHYGDKSFGMGEGRSGGYGDRTAPRGRPAYTNRNQDRERPRHFDNNSGLDPYGDSDAGRLQRTRSKFDAETGTNSGQREHKKYKKGMFKELFVSVFSAPE